MAYTTNTAVKTFMEITSADDDALLTTMIAEAQKIIDTYCDRTFEYGNADVHKFTPLTVNYGGDLLQDGLTLMFDTDCCQITTVTNGDGTVISASDYVLLPANRVPSYGIQLKANSSVRWTYNDSPEQSVQITGKWSYSATAPANIVYATKKLVKYMYTSRANSADTDRDVVSTDGVVLAQAQIPKEVLRIINPYRRLS
jgi:hypothetical protein